MSNGILRAILGVSLASLALNATVAWLVVRHTRSMARDAARAAGSASPGAAERRPPPVVEAFQRQWEFVDKASGHRLGAALADDQPRLEQFVRQAGLAPAQEVTLRDRWAARRSTEMAMAREMVQKGAWRHEDFRKLYKQFWDSEYRALAPEQAKALPPEFIPVD